MNTLQAINLTSTDVLQDAQHHEQLHEELLHFSPQECQVLHVYRSFSSIICAEDTQSERFTAREGCREEGEKQGV